MTINDITDGRRYDPRFCVATSVSKRESFIIMTCPNFENFEHFKHLQMASPSLGRRPMVMVKKYYFEIAKSNPLQRYKILKNVLRTGLCNVLNKFNLFSTTMQVLDLVFLGRSSVHCALVFCNELIV